MTWQPGRHFPYQEHNEEIFYETLRRPLKRVVRPLIDIELWSTAAARAAGCSGPKTSSSSTCTPCSESGNGWLPPPSPHLPSVLTERLLACWWSSFATKLPGRMDSEIKNYRNTHLRKKLIRMGLDPVTHRPATNLDLLTGLSNLLSAGAHGGTASHFHNALKLQVVQSLIRGRCHERNKLSRTLADRFDLD
ncbi:hypothetical protein GW17_00001945 [Ensete ventricosum]|nr:hypothetical protein GW17_00001945 [Ensete ventricosum]RZR98706.1 hypothetical protein BHM03_00028119 [Ensete ventricosum]